MHQPQDRLARRNGVRTMTNTTMNALLVNNSYSSMTQPTRIRDSHPGKLRWLQTSTGPVLQAGYYWHSGSERGIDWITVPLHTEQE